MFTKNLRNFKIVFCLKNICEKDLGEGQNKKNLDIILDIRLRPSDIG